MFFLAVATMVLAFLAGVFGFAVLSGLAAVVSKFVFCASLMLTVVFLGFLSYDKSG